MHRETTVKAVDNMLKPRCTVKTDNIADFFGILTKISYKFLTLTESLAIL